MSGAQPKAGNIAGCITVCAEVNPAAARKRYEQGWVDVLIENMHELITVVRQAIKDKQIVAIAYLGNIIEVWESFLHADIQITVGSDQTSLHNPWAGGYYPIGLTFEESNVLMAEKPEQFKKKYNNR